MPISEAKKRANRKWNESNLDRLYITVKKGDKETIRDMAASMALSINEYVSNLIYEDLKLHNMLK